MKLIFAFLFIITINSQLRSQEPSILATSFKCNGMETLVRGNDNEFLVVDNLYSKTTITIYDVKTLKKLRKVVIPDKKLPYENYTRVTPDIFYKEGKIILIYSIRVGGNEIFYGTVVENDGKISIQDKKLASVDYDERKFTWKYIISSPDMSKILIWSQVEDYEKPQPCNVIMVNDNLDKIYTRETELSNGNESFTLVSLQVHNSGKVSLLASFYNLRDIKDSLCNNVFRGYSIDNGKSDLKEIKITGDPLDGCDTYGSISSNEVPYRKNFFAGFNSKVTGTIDRLCVFDLSKIEEGSIVKHYVALDNNLINEFTKGIVHDPSEDESNSEDKGPKNYHIRDVFYDQHHDLKVILEFDHQYWIKKEGAVSGKDNFDVYDYAGTIIELTINDKNTVTNYFVIPKKQRSSFSRRLEFVTLKGNENTYYIYNDAQDNYDAKKLAKKNNDNFHYIFLKDGLPRMALVSASPEGNHKAFKKPLFKSSDELYAMENNKYLLINDNTLIFYSANDNNSSGKYFLFRVTF